MKDVLLLLATWDTDPSSAAFAFMVHYALLNFAFHSNISTTTRVILYLRTVLFDDSAVNLAMCHNRSIVDSLAVRIKYTLYITSRLYTVSYNLVLCNLFEVVNTFL